MLRLALCVFVGSGIGGVCRFLVSAAVNRLVSASNLPVAAALFPWATLLVNVAGCLIIGLIYGAVDNGTVNLSAETKTLLTAGFCGGLTTFSTFSHENYLLFQSHNPGITLLYVAVSIVLGFLAAWAGHAIVTR